MSKDTISSNVPELFTMLTPDDPSTNFDSAGNNSWAPSSVRFTWGLDTVEGFSFSSDSFLSAFLFHEKI